MKKFVFLDFGFSQFVEESCGERSLTSYRGTFSYTSSEMKKLYFLSHNSRIDVYYNDLHCLLVTLKENSIQMFVDYFF